MLEVYFFASIKIHDVKKSTANANGGAVSEGIINSDLLTFVKV